MKNIRIAFFLLIGFLCAAQKISAQDIVTKIENFAEKFRPERAYIHYDKHTYTPGETIWFKAYVMSELLPAYDSKTFYIDWLDDKGNILHHTLSPLVNAVTNGQFELPATYKGRTLTVRAYTRWMLNFDTALIYNKTIPIIIKDPLSNPQKITIVPNLQFFAEGGDAIIGVSNKIAFKATDQWGRPIHIKGVVTDSKGTVVDSLRVMHDGMGFIMLTPQAGNSYKAKWKYQTTEKTTDLPDAKTNGVSLFVTIGLNKRNFTVSYPASFASGMDSLHIVGTMFQHTVFKISKPTATAVAGVVPTNQLPYGPLTITVFDKNWNPLAERVTYIYNNAPFIAKPEFEVERWGLSYRARDEIKIKLPEEVNSSISISVTDMAIGADSSDNILSQMMLTSELKGKIHNPAYYFSDTSAKAQQYLDLVMLTNGWRRFNWSQILSGKLPKINYPKDTAYLSVSGNVAGLMPGQIGATSMIVIMLKQKDAEGKTMILPLLKDGSFNDPNAIIFDTAKIYFQLQDKGISNSMVQFMPYKLRVPPAGKGWLQSIFPDTTGISYHLMRNTEAYANSEKTKYKELEEVIVKAKGKTPVQLLDEKYTSGFFTGDAIQFDLLSDPAAMGALDIFSYLQGRVAGLQITGQGANSSLNWRGGSPQIYIDEMPADINFVSNLNVRDVAYIKAFRPPFMGGFNGANGAIAIYTRRGGDTQNENTSSLNSARIEGYTPIKEFYSPKYYTMEVPPGSDRDVRTTIYWNPNVAIDPKKKEILLSFNNNDVTDAFRVIIQGMTTDGKLIYYMTTME
mgnify:CR=1 FL=1